MKIYIFFIFKDLDTFGKNYVIHINLTSSRFYLRQNYNLVNGQYNPSKQKVQKNVQLDFFLLISTNLTTTDDNILLSKTIGEAKEYF